MNFIHFDCSLWVKIGHIFLNLFIGSNKVIVCPDSYMFEVTFIFSFRTLRYFYSCPSTFCSSTRLLRASLLNLGLLEVSSLQQYVLVHRHNIFVNLNSPLKKPCSLLSCCLCFTQHVREKKLATASALKLSKQSFDRNLCFSSLISVLIQSSIFFSARARYSESVSISNSSNLFASKNLVKKM